MLTPDKLREGFYDPNLGMLKLGMLMARKHPEKVDEFINCRTLSEVAVVAGYKACDNISDTALGLLEEWMKDKGLL